MCLSGAIHHFGVVASGTTTTVCSPSTHLWRRSNLYAILTLSLIFSVCIDSSGSIESGARANDGRRSIFALPNVTSYGSSDTYENAVDVDHQQLPDCLSDGSHFWGDVSRQRDGCCIANAELLSSKSDSRHHVHTCFAGPYKPTSAVKPQTTAAVRAPQSCEKLSRWRPIAAEDMSVRGCINSDSHVWPIEQTSEVQWLSLYTCRWSWCKARGWSCQQQYSMTSLVTKQAGQRVSFYRASACKCGEISHVRVKRAISSDSVSLFDESTDIGKEMNAIDNSRHRLGIDEKDEEEEGEDCRADDGSIMAAKRERSLLEPRAVIAQSPFHWKYVNTSEARMGQRGDKQSVLDWQASLIDSSSAYVLHNPPAYSNYVECIALGGDSGAFLGRAASKSTSTVGERRLLGGVQRCHFPFKYHGVLHHACIRHDDTQFWCASAVDSNGNYMAGQWGYCSAACPVELFECRTTFGGPQVGAICHFPFVYRETQFWRCTNLDADRAWCATEVDRHGYMLPNRWGHCDCLDASDSLPFEGDVAANLTTADALRGESANRDPYVSSDQGHTAQFIDSSAVNSESFSSSTIAPTSIAQVPPNTVAADDGSVSTSEGGQQPVEETDVSDDTESDETAMTSTAEGATSADEASEHEEDALELGEVTSSSAVPPQQPDTAGDSVTTRPVTLSSTPPVIAGTTDATADAADSPQSAPEVEAQSTTEESTTDLTTETPPADIERRQIPESVLQEDASSLLSIALVVPHKFYTDPVVLDVKT